MTPRDIRTLQHPNDKHDTATRRSFLKAAAVAGVAAGLPGLSAPLLSRAMAQDDDDAPARRLKVLVLGGTGQTGPHLTRDLLARQHEVTLFNRGNRSDDLFPDVECIIGDRALENPDGMKALESEIGKGRRWDICIDIWPHIPKMVENTARLLQPAIGQYMYVSSLSVYEDNSQPNMDETAEVGKAPDADEQEFTMALYGPFKAECENRVRKFFPEHHTIFRPGLIVGPRDTSFRGVYWPVRVRRGGEVLAPGDGSDRIQIIDGRDLTAFQVRCMEQRTNGTFNVTGPHPDQPLTMKHYLETCRDSTASEARFTWVPAAFLAAHEVRPWSNMPCWLPGEGAYAGFGSRSIARAVGAGLRFRPLADTVRATLAWYDDEVSEEARQNMQRRAGLTAEREREVLDAFHRPQDGS